MEISIYVSYKKVEDLGTFDVLEESLLDAKKDCEAYLLEFGKSPDDNDGYAIAEWTFKGQKMYAFRQIIYYDDGNIDISWTEFFTSDKSIALKAARERGYKPSKWLTVDGLIKR